MHKDEIELFRNPDVNESDWTTFTIELEDKDDHPGGWEIGADAYIIANDNNCS